MILRMMNRLFLCGSKAFAEEINKLAKKLENEGYVVTSSLEVPFKEIEKSHQVIANKMFRENEITNSNIVLVFNKDEKLDIMTIMNLQYALQSKKPLRFLFKPKKK